MSLYSDGCRAMVAGLEPERSSTYYAGGPRAAAAGSIVATPDDIRSRFALLGSEFEALDVAIRAMPKMRPEFLEGWGKILASWTAFRADQEAGAWNWLGQAAWASGSDQLDEYAQVLGHWSKAFELEGGKPPPLYTPPAGWALPDVPSSWLWGLGLVAAGVVAIAVAKVASK